MNLTPRKPVMAGDPSKLMCVISQAKLFQMQGQLEGCFATLQQIAALQEQSMASIAQTDGAQAVVPTQCAMAMTALSHVFGVEYRPASAEEMREAAGLPEVPPTAGPEPVPQPTPEEAPPRRAWKPSVIAGGKS